MIRQALFCGRTARLDHDTQRRGLIGLDVLIDEEALGVAGDVVGRQIRGTDGARARIGNIGRVPVVENAPSVETVASVSICLGAM